MSARVSFDYHYRKLQGLLSKADDRAFMQMIWAVDALQTGRDATAAKLLKYPAEAANARLNAKYAVHRWELETCLVQLFLTPKKARSPGRNRILNCHEFGAMVAVINRLRDLENAESARRLNPSGIFGELHRIAQRQFHWQRGYYNLPQLYRYWYLYCQGECAAYFEKRYGFSIHDFTFGGFGVFAACHTVPYFHESFALQDAGLENELVRRVLPLLALPLPQMRKFMASNAQTMNAKHGRPLPIAYLPSALRQFPLVGLEDQPGMFIAPIPELILLRVTSGLYYDLIGAGGKLLNEPADRFEQYCADFIRESYPRFSVRRAYQHGTRRAPLHTPDLLVADAGKIAIVAECKATKLTYLAQFADDPFLAQEQQYEQLAEGVVQVWRFFSHARRGVIQEDTAPEAYGIILTLDTYLSFSRDLSAKVFERALEISSAEPDIIDVDRRHVMFCPIQDFEQLSGRGTEDTLQAALKASTDPKYEGWALREIHRETSREQNIPRKKYPFKMAALLPWWDRLQRSIDPDDELAAEYGDD